MKQELLYSCLFLFLSIGNTFAQSSPDSTSMANYQAKAQAFITDVLTNREQERRIMASDSLELLLQEVLARPGSFGYAFEGLEGISMQVPADKAFRLFTWQLYIDKENYQYRGFLQMPDERVIRLKDDSDDMKVPDFYSYGPKEWYGALYYNIRSFEHEGQNMYLLFGYDAFSFFNRRKLLDVLHFKNGQPVFGAPVIEVKDAMGRMREVHRFLLEYSSSVSLSLNWSKEEKMIVFDHLIQAGVIKDAGPSNVPDGSYSGLKYKKGRWEYVDKVYHRISDKPLMEKPLFDKDNKQPKRDIMGRPR